jgi:hypothetical protein
MTSPRFRIDHIFGCRPSKDALAERRNDDLAGIDNRPESDAALVPQSTWRDDRILRHVDQTAGQITRVGRLQRRIGQTLTGTVGGVEVLENGQAFLEVRDDRRLDDLTDGLAIRPRIPASCFICAGEPRAPEWPSCRSS